MPLLVLPALLTAQILGAPSYSEDLDTLLSELKANGAYVYEDKIDFTKLDKTYRPQFKAAKNKADLLPVIERFVAELHDFHASPGSNNDKSPRLVPSGTDIYAVWRNGHAFVEQLRRSSLAEEAGIQPGDEILQLQGMNPYQAAAKQIGALEPGVRGWTWGLNAALGGRWNETRRLVLKRHGATHQLVLRTARVPKRTKLLSVVTTPAGVLVLRPADCLGEDDLIAAFDAEIPAMRRARGIVIDLRDTPSGGTTTVARGIMGLFIPKRMPYQRHLVEERDTNTVRDWVEYATPRLSKPIKIPLAVLVNRWTGSMGEGIAIGFDALKRGTVIGTPMAGLRGAVGPTTLPESGIRVFFPIEKVFHVDGTPRHLWTPKILVKPGPGDPWMLAAEQYLTHPDRLNKRLSGKPSTETEGNNR